LSKAESPADEERDVAFAERAGFEPALDLHPNMLSNLSASLTLTSNPRRQILVLPMKNTQCGTFVVVNNQKQTGENDEKYI
jgi:hypothetical protein